MSQIVKKLPNEPIVVLAIPADYSYKADANEALIVQLEQLFDAQTQPVKFVLDLREAKLVLEEIINGSSLATRQLHLLQHPKICSIIVVSTSRMVSLASRGMESPIFGNIHVDVTPTLDAALALARGR